NHGMLGFSLQRTRRSLRMPPVSPGNIDPPVVTVSQIHPLARFVENNRSGYKHLRLGARVILRSWGSLGGRYVLGRLDELAKLFVGHRVPVHPKAINGHVMHRRFFRIVLVGPHEKSAAGNPNHVWERRLIRFPLCLFSPSYGQVSLSPREKSFLMLAYT